MNRLFTTILILLCCTLAATAKVRTTAQKKMLAAQALTRSGIAQARAASPSTLRELRTLGGCTLVGYEDGAFAVVPNDDVHGEVVGVSSAPTHGDNIAFEWWLSAIDEVLTAEAAAGAVRHAPGPDAKKYPPSVEPMVTSEWGQGDPFYRKCPSHPDDIFCATGCVATAMAQILRYQRLPLHGFGARTIFYPYQDPTGEAVTAEFGTTTYDWDNMIDRYDEGNFSEVEADAVATLMMHCAVAADMQFGGYDHGGSGTTQSLAAEGLRYYFGFENARSLERVNYSDDEWMDMVYGELSQGHPLLYGGQNVTNGGHAFVLHGYREDGFVYVNWGWRGDADGYYDIDKLNPSAYRFSARQDMIVGIYGQKANLQSLELQQADAGTLSSRLGADALSLLGTLKVSGRVNSTDLKALRELAGRDADGNATEGNLSVLDLSDAELVAGGEPYLVENGQAYTITADGELPYKAFYDCRKLTAIRLPKNLHSVGTGALGGCYLLQEVGWPETADRTFVLDGAALYSADRTQLLAVLPTAVGTFSVPATVTKVGRLAFAGCVGLSKIELAASVSEIGGEAFRNCFSLTELRVRSKEQPTLLDYDVFAGMRLELCKLLVPSGTKSKYTGRLQWRDFGSNIEEYGTTLQANNLAKDYGDENPRLGYKMSGASVEGTPELRTDATVRSLPGTYPIYITAGTVTDPDVEFVNGTLTVYPAILTVRPVSTTRRPDEVSLPYELEFAGFVNGEDASILQELPVVTTTATDGCAEGSYTLRASGGSSDRYEFQYRTGTLTVDANAPSGIGGVSADGGADAAAPVFTLDGRRLSGRATQRGVYVRGGKKVVIAR